MCNREKPTDSVPSSPVCVSKQGENEVFHTRMDDGLSVREITIDCNTGIPPIEIVQLTDAHLSFAENMRKNWQNSLLYAAQFDYTVATGDLIEGLHGDLLRFLRESLSACPNIMLSLGNHDWIPMDDAPEAIEERYALLQRYWPNNIAYSSVLIKNKVLLIQMDNSRGIFQAEQLARLQADTSLARSNGYAILLFYHIPLHHLSFPAESPKSVSRTLYEFILNQADVIKGMFCGHLHDNYYTEISAKSFLGEDSVLRQYISHGTFAGDGYITKIVIR